MSTANSSPETRQRAESLAGQIGARHIAIDIDVAVDANLAIFQQVRTRTHLVTKFTIKFTSQKINMTTC